MTAPAPTAIHRASIDDLLKIEACAAEFYASSQFLNGFSLHRFCNLWADLLERGAGVIFAFDDDAGHWAGMLGGILHEDIYSGINTASEMFWYVREGYRGTRGMRLYREFERWAICSGCRKIVMVHLCDSMPEKLDRVYRGLGFLPAEVHYVKSLEVVQ